jgi:hypothetical protein
MGKKPRLPQLERVLLLRFSSVSYRPCGFATRGPAMIPLHPFYWKVGELRRVADA